MTHYEVTIDVGAGFKGLIHCSGEAELAAAQSKWGSRVIAIETPQTDMLALLKQTKKNALRNPASYQQGFSRLALMLPAGLIAWLVYAVLSQTVSALVKVLP